MSEKGVLLMAYGSPETLDDVEEYFAHIRGGRKPSPEAVEELKERYRRIGGRSPLLEITKAQARALERHLNADLDEGEGYRVYVGMKHWHPFIREAVERMAQDGIERAVGIALAPHYSRLSVGAYIEAAQEALEALKLKGQLEMRFVEGWHLRPSLIEAWSARVRDGLLKFDAKERDGVVVVFTAHSLPERILEWGDPYPKQLLETAEAVARRVGLPASRWTLAYQSASPTGEPWLGPDVLDVLDELSKQGVKGVLVCPIGFVADHLEVLYDIDVECRERADERGLHLERTQLLNDDPLFVRGLAEIVRGHLP